MSCVPSLELWSAQGCHARGLPPQGAMEAGAGPLPAGRPGRLLLFRGSYIAMLHAIWSSSFNLQAGCTQPPGQPSVTPSLSPLAPAPAAVRQSPHSLPCSYRHGQHAQVVILHCSHRKLQNEAEERGLADCGEALVPLSSGITRRRRRHDDNQLTISLASTRVPTTRSRTSHPGRIF